MGCATKDFFLRIFAGLGANTMERHLLFKGILYLRMSPRKPSYIVTSRVQALLGGYELLRRIEQRYVMNKLMAPGEFERVKQFVASFVMTLRDGGFRNPTREELFEAFPHLKVRRVRLRKEPERPLRKRPVIHRFRRRG